MFLPFEDRVFEGESGNLDDKVLVCDVMDVEDLIYFHEVRRCFRFRSVHFRSVPSPFAMHRWREIVG